KTRLAEELAGRAVAAGARAAWGRAWDGDGAPAYWPWVQILRAPPLAELLASDGAAPLAAIAGIGAAAAAPVEPEPQGARFALFEAMARLLREAAGRAPLLLILDDLHQADLPSLLLLKFLARDLRRSALLIVGTWRDQEARARPDAARL